ncbi:transposase family protein [Dactylosporangium sp. CA-052675]|uniref:transposase family protein n=1 Tax=Dactylosporangium sp. CA-052675 TaxID=3239927 RepID=UPI003D8E7CD9
MLASPSSLIAALSAAPTGLCPPELTIGRSAALAGVPGPRDRRGIRRRFSVVVAVAVCAGVAGYRSCTAIAEWVADLPADAAVLLDIDADRRPSETMIRRLRQALDADLLAAAIGTWLANKDSGTTARMQASDGRGRRDPARLTHPRQPGTACPGRRGPLRRRRARRHRRRHRDRRDRGASACFWNTSTICAASR